jgi:hypothetical protein
VSKLATAFLVLLFAATRANAVTVEFLQTSIDPESVGFLSGLACRNYDHIVHLDLSVSWPDKAVSVETMGYERLVFWSKTDEYLFPKNTYFFLHGSYIIKGYFIARAGGTHQGVTSNAFEKIDDAQVMLSPNVVERKTMDVACK